MTQLFYDSEFTGLTQSAQLISIGLTNGQGESFYAEFTDVDITQCDNWIIDNVIANTRYLKNQQVAVCKKQGRQWQLADSSAVIAAALKEWLSHFATVEIWADCLAYDWVLFCELFGGSQNLPDNIHYMPGDIATLFRLKGINPDTNREAFANISAEGMQIPKHNALWDAEVSRQCFLKLMAMPWPK